jgi:hypothetical protein
MAHPQPGEALDDGSELYERKGNLTALAAAHKRGSSVDIAGRSDDIRPMAKKIKEDVKEHLRKRNIPESKLTDDVIDALNAFSKEELDQLNRVDKLGAALMDDGMLDDKQKISAVH